MQLLRGAPLRDPSAVQYDHLIRPGQGGDPVGDKDHCGRAEPLLDGGTDFGVGLGVHGGERVVKDENGSVSQQRPCNGGPLLLTAGEGHAPLAHKGVVPVGKALDGLGEAGGGRGFFHVGPGGPGLAHGDVVGNGAAEKIGLLQHHGDVPPQIVGLDFPDVHAADGDAPALRRQVIEFVQQQHHGALAGAGAAQNAQRGAVGNGQVDAPQYLMALLVGEMHVFKPDVPGHVGLMGAGGVLLHRRVHNVHQSVQ